jgi:hypothetical protein
MSKVLDPKKVGNLAELLNLSVGRIEVILGGQDDELFVKIQQSSTIQEAIEAYFTALEGSKAKRLALEKWQDLALKKAQQASTIQEAREAYNTALVGSEAERLAMEKMYDLI